jgi:hypothetical protein
MENGSFLFPLVDDLAVYDSRKHLLKRGKIVIRKEHKLVVAPPGE